MEPLQGSVLAVLADSKEMFYRFQRTDKRIGDVTVLDPDIIPKYKRTYGPSAIEEPSKLDIWNDHWITLTAKSNNYTGQCSVDNSFSTPVDRPSTHPKHGTNWTTPYWARDGPPAPDDLQLAYGPRNAEYAEKLCCALTCRCHIHNSVRRETSSNGSTPPHLQPESIKSRNSGKRIGNCSSAIDRVS